MSKLIRCDICKKIIEPEEQFDVDGYESFLTVKIQAAGRRYHTCCVELCSDCIDKCLKALNKEIKDFYDFEDRY